MHTVWDILAVLLIALGAACAVYYTVLLARAIYSARVLPTVRRGLTMPEPEGGWPRVCLIVPAHNERDVIAELAGTVRAQDYTRLNVVFVLDRCTDDTRAVLEAALADAASPTGIDPRCEILEVTHCPEDWAGKTHAAWRGVQDSRGARGAELLLFADADTLFHPGLVRAAVAMLRARDLHMLSLLSTLTLSNWYERFVQPAAGLELVRQFPLDSVARGRRAFANGQFMLFRRDAYDAVGGHGAVKGALLEDLALSRRMVRKHRMRAHTLMGDGVLVCRMYRSWEAFVRGWKRIYSEAARGNATRLARNAWRLRAAGTLLPLGAASAMVAGFAALAMGERSAGAMALACAGGAGMLAFAAAMSSVYRAQRAPLWCAAAYPFAAWRTAGILAEAAHDLRSGRATQWGGRAYARKVRR